MFVYTIQPVVKLVCQTGCTTRFDNRLNEQWLFVQHGYHTGCQTELYNRFDNRVERTVCSFNTVVKPVVKSVWQPVWQPVGCLFTRYSPLSNRLFNRFDNRLYHVNGVLQSSYEPDNESSTSESITICSYSVNHSIAHIVNCDIIIITKFYS